MPDATQPSWVDPNQWRYILDAVNGNQDYAWLIASIGRAETGWGTTGLGRPSSGGYILGYGATDSGNLTQYAGFTNQIDAVAARIRQFFGGGPVTPQGIAQFQYQAYQTDAKNQASWIDNVTSFFSQKPASGATGATTGEATGNPGTGTGSSAQSGSSGPTASVPAWYQWLLDKIGLLPLPGMPQISQIGQAAAQQQNAGGPSGSANPLVSGLENVGLVIGGGLLLLLATMVIISRVK